MKSRCRGATILALLWPIAASVLLGACQRGPTAERGNPVPPAAETPVPPRPPQEPAAGPARPRYAESRVVVGIQWLPQAQEPDGHWSCRSWAGAADYDTGVTSLALAAMDAAGYTPGRGRVGAAMAKGIAWLTARQAPDGTFAHHTFDEHTIATFVVTELAYRHKDPALRSAAQKALDTICRLQPPHGGFGPQGAAPKEDGDMWTTAWAILALQGAAEKESGLRVPEAALLRARAFLAATYRGEGRSADRPGAKEPSAAATAMGTALRMWFWDERYGDEIQAGVAAILDYAESFSVPGREPPRPLADLRFAYFTALVMAHHRENWETWLSLGRWPLQSAQVLAQTGADGRPVRGSWDPADFAWGREGGRVYTTAMAVMILATIPNHLAIYKQEGEP